MPDDQPSDADPDLHAPHGPLPEGGTVRPMTRWGTAVMHRPQQPVTAYDDELRTLVADMVATMYAADGVGLAACQIGVDLAVFVFDCPDESGERTVGVVCNPVAHAARGPGPPPRRRRRGLPVLPGRLRRVCARPTSPRVDGTGLDGEPVTSRATGCWPAASSTRPTTPSAPSSATGCRPRRARSCQGARQGRRGLSRRPGRPDERPCGSPRANARFQQWEALLDQPLQAAPASASSSCRASARSPGRSSEGWTVRALLRDGRPRPRPGPTACGPSHGRPSASSWPPSCTPELGEQGRAPSWSPSWRCPTTASRAWRTPRARTDRSWSSTGRPARATSAPWPAPRTPSARRRWSSPGTPPTPTTRSAVRASTGSLFALTVAARPRHRDRCVELRPGPRLPDRRHRRGGQRRSQRSTSPGRVVVVVGNETHGITAGWRAACDDVASIPMAGSA